MGVGRLFETRTARPQGEAAAEAAESIQSHHLEAWRRLSIPESQETRF